MIKTNLSTIRKSSILRKIKIKDLRIKKNFNNYKVISLPFYVKFSHNRIDRTCSTNGKFICIIKKPGS